MSAKCKEEEEEAKHEGTNIRGSLSEHNVCEMDFQSSRYERRKQAVMETQPTV